MRVLAIIAAVSLALTTAPAFAASSTGPYTLDAKGKCHAANGQFAKQSMCKAVTKRCRDPKTGKFAKCGAPGAVPIP